MRPIDADALIEFCAERWIPLNIDAVNMQPTIPPVATDTNVGDKISKFIDGLEEIFADLRERHVDDSVCGLCEYDGAYMGQSGDWCNECPGFDRDDCFKLSDETRKKWTEEIIKALSTIQPEERTEKRMETHGMCLDAISRQAAIDIERNATVDTNPSHFEAHQKFTQFMDDVEVSSFGRWQWANGFNTALTAVGIDLKKLPIAQPKPHEGHWINGKCDLCGEHAPFWCMASTYHESNYCPNCGAKMTISK